MRQRLLSFALIVGIGFLLVALPGALPAHAAEKVKVEVSGVGGDVKRNVLATLSLDEALHDKDLDEQRLRRLHAKAPDEIQTALQPFGYYRPTVKSTLEREKGTWVARYEIDPGPPLKVTVLDVRVDGPGSGDVEYQRRVRDFPLRQGSTVIAPAYEAGKQSFVEYAAATGYLDADFTESQIRVDLATYTADVVLHFQTGPRYLFGPVTFVQRFLNNDLLKGYVSFKEGEPLDVNKLLALQTALNDSPYFQRVEVLTREDQKQGLEVPIEVDLQPSKRQHWRFGVGYGTDTGPRGTAALELRHINRRGHNAQIELKGSGIEKSATASYQIPGAYPRTDVVTWSAGYADLRPKTSVSRRFIVGPGLTRAHGEWRQAFSFDFQREVFTVGLDKGTSKLLLPQASWTLVRADDRIYTTNGEKVELDLRAADKALVSNASLVQAAVSGKLIRTFAGRFRLITRAQLGATATSDFHALPPSIRFFAGGDESVRGYAYQQLGELDAARHVIGGKDLVTGSVEVDYRLPALHFLERWGVAAFFDAGNARNTFSGKLETGTGVGLRWISPIGPLRLDFAWAMTQPGHPLRIHLTVGPDL